jgi:hypothetical protein
MRDEGGCDTENSALLRLTLAGIEGVGPQAYGCPMAESYEEQWPTLRVGWAKEKIKEWERHLHKDGIPLLERRKLEHDLVCIKLALKDWEDQLNA